MAIDDRSKVTPKKKGKFLLFASDIFYPVGGWDDLIGRYDTIEEARLEGIRLKAGKHCYDNADRWQIVDLSSNEVVDEDEGGDYGE